MYRHVLKNDEVAALFSGTMAGDIQRADFIKLIKQNSTYRMLGNEFPGRDGPF